MGCRNFLLACELYLAEFPDFTPMQKTSMVIQHLTGRALEWALAIWRRGGTASSVYDEFIGEFKTVFDHPDQGQSCSQLLWQLQQRLDIRAVVGELTGDCVFILVGLDIIYSLAPSEDKKLK